MEIRAGTMAAPSTVRQHTRSIQPCFRVRVEVDHVRIVLSCIPLPLGAWKRLGHCFAKLQMHGIPARFLNDATAIPPNAPNSR